MAPATGSTVSSGAGAAAGVGSSSLDNSTKIVLIVVVIALVVLAVFAYLFKRSKSEKEKSEEEIPYKTGLYQTEMAIARGREKGAYGAAEVEGRATDGQRAEPDAGANAPWSRDSREWKAQWAMSERRRRDSTLLRPEDNTSSRNSRPGRRQLSWEQRLSRHNSRHVRIPSSPLPSPLLSPIPSSPLPPPSPRADTTRDSYIAEMQENMTRLSEAGGGDLGTAGRKRGGKGSKYLRGFLLPGDERDRRRSGVTPPASPYFPPARAEM